jgi:hypothetical protein
MLVRGLILLGFQAWKRSRAVAVYVSWGDAHHCPHPRAAVSCRPRQSAVINSDFKDDTRARYEILVPTNVKKRSDASTCPSVGVLEQIETTNLLTGDVRQTGSGRSGWPVGNWSKDNHVRKTRGFNSLWSIAALLRDT